MIGPLELHIMFSFSCVCKLIVAQSGHHMLVLYC